MLARPNDCAFRNRDHLCGLSQGVCQAGEHCFMQGYVQNIIGGDTSVEAALIRTGFTSAETSEEPTG